MRKILATVIVVLLFAVHSNNALAARFHTYTKKEILNADKLILVNKSRRLPTGYKFGNLERASSYVDVRFSNIYMNKKALVNMQKMFEDAKKQGINLYVYSGYRTEYEQTQAYNRKVNSYISIYGDKAEKMASKIVAIPNTSEHQTGLAADIVSTEYRVRDAGFAESKSGQWLAKNSWKYGFILRYQAHKTRITKIVFEPWHFRFVGKKPAKTMFKNDLCLEEYHQMLSNQKPSPIPTYKPEDGPLPSPSSTTKHPISSETSGPTLEHTTKDNPNSTFLPTNSPSPTTPLKPTEEIKDSSKNIFAYIFELLVTFFEGLFT